jgi:hypothetical protein
MEQQTLADYGGRRSGIDRRVQFTHMSLDAERRTGVDRRDGLERRLKIRFVSGTIKNLNTIKFEKPSTIRNILNNKSKKV